VGPLRARFFTAEGGSDVGCVEVAFCQGEVGVGDSEDHGTGPVPGLTAHVWKWFMVGAGNGESALPG
jgi:uncharacterized protein DUF397